MLACILCIAGFATAPLPSNDDIVVDAAAGPAIWVSPDSVQAALPFAQGGSYLWAAPPKSGEDQALARVPAPAGTFHVYIAWARHPRGGRDVLVRLGDRQVRVDQSRLANGLDPDGPDHDDMGEYTGICSSGLFRLTDEPLVLRGGEPLEVIRADGSPDTVTTLDYVVFSPDLYLDDLGNDAALAGPLKINLRDYGRAFSGDVGFGLAFLPPDAGDAAIEWSVPCDGLYLVEANVNRGPSRAPTIALEVVMPDGHASEVGLAGRYAAFGRKGWQTVAVLQAQRGTKLRLRPGAGGVACCDLLRLRTVSEGLLRSPADVGDESFTVQWQKPTRQRPWLRHVRVVPAGPELVQVIPLGEVEDGWRSVEVRLPRAGLPVLGRADERVLPAPSQGAVRVELDRDYGFTLSAKLLRQQEFVWLKDLGMFAAIEGTWASHRADIRAMVAATRSAGLRPFRSPAEEYRESTGYTEDRPGQGDRAFEFAYDMTRPLEPRVSAAIAAMPEATYDYFLPRVQEPRHRRMFLGWPNVCQEFYVLSNGTLGISSGSGTGTGHPPAEHFVVAFGAGDPPSFREHGDPNVHQRIEDGYHLVVHTSWAGPGAELECTAFAYPLVGEEVHTGNEPLGAFVRYARAGGRRTPQWLRVRPDGWGGPENPLPGLASARVVDGLLMVGGRIILGIARGGAEVASASEQEVLVRLIPAAGAADIVVPYVAVDAGVMQQALSLGFERARGRTRDYWDGRLRAGALIEVPDRTVEDQYRTLYPRTLICGDLDVRGDYALKTSPIIYDRVWLHATAYGIEGLARRGHFAEAKQYLDAAFRWQGSQPSEAAGEYTTWDGFFTAPPHYTALLWLNFHGWMQWAAARYFLFSDDRAYLEEKLPALVASLEWTASQRRLTMKPSPDGVRPPSYGWLPPGRVTDGSGGTSTFTDCINWMGLHEVTRLLERVGHPRASEFRREADDYRACILRGLRLAAREREPVRLRDGTFVPYVPGYLESAGHEEGMWYAAVVDGALEGILDSGVVPRGDPLEDWVLANLEDNLFVMAPNLADEAYFLGHGCGYLRRDEPKQAIYTLYSVLASHSARDTRTTFEHRSWGAGRVYELSPWPMGYYTRMLAAMLCYDEGDDLTYCRATPSAWLEPGRTIRVERLQTRFGPTSFVLRGEEHRISGAIDLPTRYPPSAIRLRLRVDGEIEGVRLNGQRATFDPGTATVALPVGVGRVDVEVEVRRLH